MNGEPQDTLNGGLDNYCTAVALLPKSDTLQAHQPAPFPACTARRDHLT
uniref:Uncharacterized protein n=1 Tax=Arundo donax TaxID=35708 RepID=A0A0A8YH68_ARUDO